MVHHLRVERPFLDCFGTCVAPQDSFCPSYNRDAAWTTGIISREICDLCVWFFLWGFEATVFLGKSLNLTDSRNTMPGANGAEITAAEPASFGENLRWPTLQSFAPHQCEYMTIYVNIWLYIYTCEQYIYRHTYMWIYDQLGQWGCATTNMFWSVLISPRSPCCVLDNVFLFLFLYMSVLWGFEPNFGDGLGYGLGRQHPVQCVKDAALVGFFFYVQS